jgi:hypothetical protein
LRLREKIAVDAVVTVADEAATEVVAVAIEVDEAATAVETVAATETKTPVSARDAKSKS